MLNYYGADSSGSMDTVASTIGSSSTVGQTKGNYKASLFPSTNTSFHNEFMAGVSQQQQPQTSPLNNSAMTFMGDNTPYRQSLNPGGNKFGNNYTYMSIYQEPFNPNNNDNGHKKREDPAHLLAVELQYKNSQIEALEKEVEQLNQEKLEMESQGKNDVMSGSSHIGNYEQLYTEMSTKLKDVQAELEDTKERLECVLTAIAMNPVQGQYQAITKDGRYDEQEIAHKVLTKLRSLTKENEEMAKMLSYGRSKQKDIEIGLLKEEVRSLKEKLKVQEQ